MSSSLEKVLPYGPKGPEANVIVAKGVVNVSFDKKVRSDDVVNAAMAAGHRIPDPYACSGLLKPDIPAYSWTYLPKSPACYAQEQLTATAIPPRQEVILTTQSTDSGFDWGLFCCLPLAAVVIGSVAARVLGGKKNHEPTRVVRTPEPRWGWAGMYDEGQPTQISAPGPMTVTAEHVEPIGAEINGRMAILHPAEARIERYITGHNGERTTVIDKMQVTYSGEAVHQQMVIPAPSVPPTYELDDNTLQRLADAAIASEAATRQASRDYPSEKAYN